MFLMRPRLALTDALRFKSELYSSLYIYHETTRAGMQHCTRRQGHLFYESRRIVVSHIKLLLPPISILPCPSFICPLRPTTNSW